MSAYSDPRKMSGRKASRQARFRTTNFRNCSPDFRNELKEVMWSKVFRCMAGMRPHELHRIELRCAGRKGINVQTRFSLDKVLDQASLMNGMVIPDQDNGTGNATQDLFEEQDHMFTTQIYTKRSHRQLYLSSSGADQDGAQQVQSLMMVQTGVYTRCLTTRRPAASQWRN
jgi:hypothetical protein